MWVHGQHHLDMVLVTAVGVFLFVCGPRCPEPTRAEHGVVPSSARPSTQLGPALVAVGPSRRTCPSPSPPDCPDPPGRPNDHRWPPTHAPSPGHPQHPQPRPRDLAPETGTEMSKLGPEAETPGRRGHRAAATQHDSAHTGASADMSSLCRRRITTVAITSRSGTTSASDASGEPGVMAPESPM